MGLGILPMTILTDLKERRRLAQARRQPHLWFTPFSVPEILERVRAEHFPEAPPDVGLFSVNRGPLACIEVGESSPTIYVHQVLNHAETPEEVFTLICKHELLHLRIEPALEGKRLNQHPSAFWEAEKTIAPERRLAWCWIWENLGDCLRRRPRLERIDVQPRWPEVWSRQMCDLSFCRDLLRRTDKAFEPSSW